MLTERVRYRLTGTVFLLAVAAVLVPMLFDGEGVAPMHLEPVPGEPLDIEPDRSRAPDMAEALDVRRSVEALVDEDGFGTETGTRWGEPILAEDDAESDAGWAVQLGSFSRPENAKELRDALLEDGFAGFMSTVKRDGDVATRVAVGPLINRDDAVRLKAQLDARYEIDAVIVSFGP